MNEHLAVDPCPYCGRDFEYFDYKHCPNCGKRLGDLIMTMEEKQKATPAQVAILLILLAWSVFMFIIIWS